MDTRLTTTLGLATTSLRRPALALLVAVALLPMRVVPASVAATDCLVTNSDTGQTFTVFQGAVDAASAGNRLTVQGICHGTTVIDKDLIISGLESEASGRPILDGDGLGTVVTVVSAVVSIEDLTIEHGIAVERRNGGGLTNRLGTLTLRDVIVRRNRGGPATRRYGSGGIFNQGTLTLAGTTRISGNTGVPSGVRGFSGTVTMNGASAIRGNDGRGVLLGRGALTMNGHSSIHDNRGGVLAGGAMVMNDRSSVRDNGSRYEGGGGVVLRGSDAALTMYDSSTITRNRAWRLALSGGVHVGEDASLIMNDASTITANTVGPEYPDRFGYAQGGGVYDGGGSLVGVICAPKAGANVYDNGPDDCARFTRPF